MVFLYKDTFAYTVACDCIKGSRKTESMDAYARIALADLVTLLYEAPIGPRLKTRERLRFVRVATRRMRDEISSSSFVEFIQRMKKLANAFQKALRWSDEGLLTFTISDFLLTSPISLMMVALARNLDSDPIPLIRFINTWHEHLGKIAYPRPDLQAAAEAEWFDQQKEVFSISDPDTNRSIDYDTVMSLRTIVAWLMSGADSENWDMTAFRRHGPGNAVFSDGRRSNILDDKELEIEYIHQAQSIAPVYRGSSLVHRFKKRAPVLPRPYNAVYANVEKDNGSRRSITQEPADMMMAQQAMKHHIYSLTDSRKIHLGRFVTFTDQTPSQIAAVAGSCYDPSDSSLATLDCKRASDRISSDLVAFVFSGDLLHKLMALRTWDVDALEPDGKGGFRVTRTVQLRMYAGMGSACTFSVQSIIFSAICLLGCIRAWSIKRYGAIDDEDALIREALSHSFQKSSKNFWRYGLRVRVFGDDLIVPEIAVSHVKDIMERVGLLLNVQKSFSGSDAVRESCGIFACAGQDITPLRFRVPYYNPKEPADFAVYDATRMYANRAYVFGFRHLSRRIVRRAILLSPFGNGEKLGQQWAMLNGQRERTSGPKIRERNVEYLKHTTPQMLYEPYRGDVDYVGFISNRKNRLSEGILMGETVSYVSSYVAIVKTDRIAETTQAYVYDMALSRVYATDEPSMFPRIPRGIRLEKRIAYLPNSGDQRWAWAPIAAP